MWCACIKYDFNCYWTALDIRSPVCLIYFMKYVESEIENSLYGKSILGLHKKNGHVLIARINSKILLNLTS